MTLACVKIFTGQVNLFRCHGLEVQFCRWWFSKYFSVPKQTM